MQGHCDIKQYTRIHIVSFWSYAPFRLCHFTYEQPCEQNI